MSYLFIPLMTYEDTGNVRSTLFSVHRVNCASRARSQESLTEGHNWFLNCCRDSSEIYHCLLRISFGKSRFKPPTILDQLFLMTTVSVSHKHNNTLTLTPLLFPKFYQLRSSTDNFLQLYKTTSFCFGLFAPLW
jgi:hypothetical protein